MQSSRQSRLKLSLLGALALHSLLAVVLLWSPSASVKPPEPAALELVTLPSQEPAPQETPVAPSPAPSPPKPTSLAPEPLSLPESPLDAIPDLVVPKPRPPAPKPQSAPPKAAKPQTAPKPPAKPAAAPQRMTYEAFLKKQGKSVNPAQAPVSAARLELPVLEAPAPSASSVRPPSPAPRAPRAVPASVLAQLRSAIDAHWQKPALPKNLQAEVSFSVTASGHLEAVRLEHPSGNAAFDSSIQAALRATQLSPVPSELLHQRFRLTFCGNF